MEHELEPTPGCAKDSPANGRRSTDTLATYVNSIPRKKTEPRWPALVALVGAGALYAALPSSLLVAGSRWLLVVLVLLLIVPAEVSHRRGNHSLNQIIGYLLNGFITLAMILSLTLLIKALADHKVAPPELLRSAAALWVTNILIFASWYWRLD